MQSVNNRLSIPSNTAKTQPTQIHRSLRQVTLHLLALISPAAALARQPAATSNSTHLSTPHQTTRLLEASPANWRGFTRAACQLPGLQSTAPDNQPPRSNMIVASGSGSAIALYDNTQLQLCTAESMTATTFNPTTFNPAALRQYPAADLIGVAVDQNHLVTLQPQRITLYQLPLPGHSASALTQLASFDLTPVFPLPSDTPRLISLQGDRIAVVGLRSGQESLLVLQRDSDNGFTPINGSTLLEPGEPLFERLVLSGDFVVVSNQDKALALWVEDTPSSTTPAQVTPDTLCAGLTGECVDTLMIGSTLFQASHGALQIYNASEDRAIFEATSMLERVGDLFVADGAKIIGMQPLSGHQLVLLKNYDKLVVVDVTSRTSPKILNTVTLNTLTQNGFTDLRLLQHDQSTLAVLIGRGEQGGLFLVPVSDEPPSNQTPRPPSNSPSTSASISNDTAGIDNGPDDVDLTPYLTPQSHDYPLWGVTFAQTGAFLMQGMRVAERFIALGNDRFALFAETYQGLNRLRMINPVEVAPVIQLASPAVGMAVSGLASLRIGLLLPKVNTLTQTVNELVDTARGLARYLEETLVSDGPVEGVVGRLSGGSDWVSRFLEALNTPGTTAQSVYQTMNIDAFVSGLERQLLRYYELSDQLDDTDIFIEIDFGRLEAFVSLFETLVAAVFVSGYDGDNSGSFTEETVATALNHAFRSASNARLVGQLIQQFSAAIGLTIEQMLTTALQQPDRLSEMQTAYTEITKAFDALTGDLTEVLGDSEQLLTESLLPTIRDSAQPFTLGLVSYLIGVLGEGIAQVVLPNAHSGMAAMAAALTGFEPLDGTINERFYDGVTTMVALAAGALTTAEPIRRTEKTLTDTGEELAALIARAGDLLENTAGAVRAAQTLIRSLTSVLEDAYRSVKLTEFSGALVDLIEDKALFARDLETLRLNDLGNTAGYIAEEMIMNLAADNTEQIEQGIAALTALIEDAIARFGSQGLEWLFDVDLNQLSPQLASLGSYLAAFQERLSDQLQLGSEQLNDLSQQISDPKLFWIEYAGLVFATAAGLVLFSNTLKNLVYRPRREDFQQPIELASSVSSMGG